jgi:RNA polymerase sigma-70 factor (ECF subfamily)
MTESTELKAWFGQCIEECMDSLYSLALRLTRNSTEAEDLVADSVARAWMAINTLDDRARFRAWMFRILHNRFISDYRRDSVRPVTASLDETPDNDDGNEITPLLVRQSDEFLYWWANPEREFSNNLLGEDIMRAIDSLPEAFRVTVLLVNVEGLSYDDAAKVLDVPPGTVRSRMKRGRTLLQRALWQHAQDAGLINDAEPSEGTLHE